MKNFLLDLLFPRSCLRCQKLIAHDRRGYMCDKCHEILDVAEDLRCAFCTSYSPHGLTCNVCKPKHALDRLLVAANYKKKIVERMAKTLKYRFATDVAIDIARIIKKRFPRVEVDCLIPIPLHKSRLRWRGFNQAELIASELSLLWKIPVRTDLLIRKKSPPPQADIKDRNSRIANAKNIFDLVVEPLSKVVQPLGTIILVDDLSTTGSTLDEAAKVLKLSGVEKVIGVVFARG